MDSFVELNLEGGEGDGPAKCCACQDDMHHFGTLAGRNAHIYNCYKKNAMDLTSCGRCNRIYQPAFSDKMDIEKRRCYFVTLNRHNQQCRSLQKSKVEVFSDFSSVTLV